MDTFDLSSDRLTAAIRETFPDLAFQDVQRIDGGDDHVVLLLDDELVFRFPRSLERQAPFAVELRLLAELVPRTPVPVPDYRWIAPGAAFGGYRRLPGGELSRGRFEALDASAQVRVLDQIADLLNVLHPLPHDLLARPDGDFPRAWTGADYAARWREQRRALTAPLVEPPVLARFDRFYDAFERLAPGVSRLCHDDLTDDHLLVERDSLSGVIDFADASIGDAAIDFCFLWTFGDEAPRRVFHRYALAAEDPDLLHRSLWSYARLQIERLHHHPPAEQTAWLHGEIDRTLRRLRLD